jgi:DNA-binding transcriptional regulator YdaS (Cro superfamily)
MDHRHPLDIAAAEVDGIAGLASILGVTPQAVSSWKTHGVPIQRCIPIEKASNGVITRLDLREDARDIWPEYKRPRIKRRATART